MQSPLYMLIVEEINKVLQKTILQLLVFFDLFFIGTVKNETCQNDLIIFLE